MKSSEFYAVRTGMEPGDLLNEAIRRALEEQGGRNCPRDVKAVTFLSNAMRSIASAEREKWLRELPMGSTGDDETDPVSSVPDSAGSPEQTAIEQIDYERTLTHIETIFEDDPKALAIVMGDMEGASKDEILELEPMSDTEYATARRRVRRRFLSEFPKGPNSDH